METGRTLPPERGLSSAITSLSLFAENHTGWVGVRKVLDDEVKNPELIRKEFGNQFTAPQGEQVQ
jgi:hypothetical protein